MKIIIDINHPAHVHYFKHFIKIMEAKGHVITVFAKDKEVTFSLLTSTNIKFINKGKGSKSFIGKLLTLIKYDLKILFFSLKFKPDLFLSFGSPYNSNVSLLLRKPNIVFDDTEVGSYEQLMYKLNSVLILNPLSFKKRFKKNQFLFDSFMELCYLMPKYFSPNNNILKKLGIKEGEKFYLFRFVAWNASHDMNQSGLSDNQKKELIAECLKYGKVFISSEAPLPKDLEQYQIKVNPDELHDVIYYTDLYIGEGATTASECALIGTPAIYVNSIDAGTIQEQQNSGLLFSYRNYDGVLEKVKELLSVKDIKTQFKSRRDAALSNKIDVTAFLVWLVENYPQSVEIIKKNPDYQYNFK